MVWTGQSFCSATSRTVGGARVIPASSLGTEMVTSGMSVSTIYTSFGPGKTRGVFMLSDDGKSSGGRVVPTASDIGLVFSVSFGSGTITGTELTVSTCPDTGRAIPTSFSFSRAISMSFG